MPKKSAPSGAAASASEHTMFSSDGAQFRVVGDEGPVVLLLPGGAEAVDGFFPGLVEALVSDPGCRVVLYDRPGIGTNELPGRLKDASTALHEVLQRHQLGPVVVVGQSLGGAVAALLARDYPQDVAGLVLLDPSTVNDERFASFTEKAIRLQARLVRTPVLRDILGVMMKRSQLKIISEHNLSRESSRALTELMNADIPSTSDAAKGLANIAATFDERPLPKLPAAVVTADRKESDPVRKAHARLAKDLDAPLLQWTGALHMVHLTHPKETIDICRTVIRAVIAAEHDRL